MVAEPNGRPNPERRSSRRSTLAEAGKPQEAEAAFAKLATDGTAGYRVLARLREAAELAQTDPKAAVKAYDEIAADRSDGQVMQDIARCAPGFCLLTRASYSDMRARLEPLTGADRAFRHSARELLALSAWKRGEIAAARQWTDMIITDPQTPAAARSRAEVLSELHRRGRQGLSGCRRDGFLAGLGGSGVALVLVLGACTPGGQFDPTEVLSTDIFNTKKKLAGEREPLFPQRRAG